MGEDIAWLCYLAVSMIGLVVTLSSRKSPDVFDLSFAGMLVYSLPLLQGVNFDPLTGYPLEISATTYQVMLIPMSLLVIALFQSSVRFESGLAAQADVVWPRFMTIAGYMALMLLVGVVLRDLADVRHLGSILSKKEMSELTTGAGSLFLVNTLVSFCAAWATLRRNWIVVALVVFLALVQATIFQSRSAFVFSAIVIALALALQRETVSPRYKASMALSAIALFALVAGYKTVKGKLLRPEMWSAIPSPLDSAFWKNVMMTMEPQKTVYLLNGVVEKSISIDLAHLTSILLKAIPFSGTLFSLKPEKWGRLVQEDIFGPVDHGFGNNIWAELYSIGGMFAVLTGAFLWIGGVALLHKGTRAANPAVMAASLALVPAWCFFITRVSLGSTLSTVVNGVILLAVMMLLGALIFSALRQWHRA